MLISVSHSVPSVRVGDCVGVFPHNGPLFVQDCVQTFMCSFRTC